MVQLTRDEAVAQVQQGLGFRTDLQTEIILALRLAQQELELGEKLPWFMLAENVTLQNQSAALDTITLPTDFLQEEELDGGEGSLWYYDSDWVPLAATDWATLEQARTQNTYVGFSHYAVKDSSIILGPIAPTVQYTFRLRYYAAAVDLTTNVTNAWLSNAAEMLIGAAGVKLARDIGDDAARKRFVERFAVSEAAVQAADTMRRYGTSPQSMGA